MRWAPPLLALLSACGTPRHGSVAASEAAGEDAVIYLNAVVHTLADQPARAAGLRVASGRVTHLLEGEPGSGLEGRRVDLGGAVVLPGLVDSHLHLQGIGAAARQLDLRGTGSAEEVAELVRSAAAQAAPGAWIRGRGWDQNDWPGAELPGHEVLDAAAPENPVALRRVDGHATWVNDRALALAGIAAGTPDPEGGEILRDESGVPTGVLVDNAAELLEARIPAPTAEEIREDLLEALDRCARVGLTAVHDMGTTPAVLDVLRALEAEGLLRIRVFAYLDGAAPGVEELLAEPPDRRGLLRVTGLKLFADGALGSRGAALLEPYADRPGTSGLVVTPEEELRRLARLAHERGYQVAIHAIGDRGCRIALDAIAAAQGTVRGRHRLEHAQVLDDAEVSRFAALGVAASMQPTHATSDMPWAPARLGAERLRGAYAWRRLLDAGALLPLGSDAPVESQDPWLGVHAAVTRQDRDGHPEGGWLPDQRLGLREALEGFSLVPARVVGLDAAPGLVPGARADLTVVDRDPFAIDPRELHRVRTLRTVVEGREVFVAE